MKHLLKIFLSIITVLILCGVGIMAFISHQFNKSLEPKVNPDLYPAIVSSRQENSARYDFLPKIIPPYAKQTAFYHVPGFLQGGDTVILRIEVPALELKSELKKLIESDRDEISTFGDIPAPRPLVDFNIINEDSDDYYNLFSELSPDYRVFLYESNLKDIKENWNHNFLAFTAISEKANEIIYYVDNW